MNYQEKVSTRADVRALYDKVKQNPAVMRYRGYTETKSYGWDEAADDYIKCDGEVWFNNPAYDVDFVSVGEGNDTATELLDEQLDACRARIDELESETAMLTHVNEDLKEKLTEANTKATTAAKERDEARELVGELRRILLQIAELVNISKDA